MATSWNPKPSSNECRYCHTRDLRPAKAAQGSSLRQSSVLTRPGCEQPVPIIKGDYDYYYYVHLCSEGLLLQSLRVLMVLIIIKSSSDYYNQQGLITIIKGPYDYHY